MQTVNIEKILAEEIKDDSLSRHFIPIWSEIMRILDAFAMSTNLPIFVYFFNRMVYSSSVSSMPAFCQKMLNNPNTLVKCCDDGLIRAYSENENEDKSFLMCHAGMLTIRRELDTGIGTMIMLVGAKPSSILEAKEKRKEYLKLIQKKSNKHIELGRVETKINLTKELTENQSMDFPKLEMDLLSAIIKLIQELLTATIGFQFHTINMSHELTLMLDGLGLTTARTQRLLEKARLSSNMDDEEVAILDKAISNQKNIYQECRLGLLIVRNFLSHVSETRYKEVYSPRLTPINLHKLLVDIISLYQIKADSKKISIITENLSQLPEVYGIDLELRRLFHNVLNNSIKYSYHSVSEVNRTIKVGCNVPYDPGFSKPRFAVYFENYGLGFTSKEKQQIFQPGFRSQQARDEVPIGAGIGLSEVRKIIELHRGEIKINSKEVHLDIKGKKTYLTRVTLIFPVRGK
jgi:signal transduction histidine kinase